MVITTRVLINILRVFVGLGGTLALIILSVAVEGVWDGGTYLAGTLIVIGSMIGVYIATRMEFKNGAGE